MQLGEVAVERLQVADLDVDLAAAAEAMRRILVDNARRKRSLKRGWKLERQELNDECLALPEPREDLIALDEALDKLAAKPTARPVKPVKPAHGERIETESPY